MNIFLQAGCTAIQLASATGNFNIVKILLQNGAKPEKQDSSVSVKGDYVTLLTTFKLTEFESISNFDNLH